MHRSDESKTLCGSCFSSIVRSMFALERCRAVEARLISYTDVRVVANMLRFGCRSQVRTFQLDTDGEADGETETRWNR